MPSGAFSGGIEGTHGANIIFEEGRKEHEYGEQKCNFATEADGYQERKMAPRNIGGKTRCCSSENAGFRKSRSGGTQPCKTLGKKRRTPTVARSSYFAEPEMLVKAKGKVTSGSWNFFQIGRGNLQRECCKKGQVDTVRTHDSYVV